MDSTDAVAPGSTRASTKPLLYSPLDRLRVVEFGTFVAVPSATMTLASLGAEVIRIDPIGGASDTTRAPVDRSGASIYWASLNKGKRSVTLNLRTSEGQELAQAIATAPGPESGFFITNAVGDGWFNESALRVRRRDLVWIRLLGNSDGRPALDYTVNWEVGFSEVTGPSDSLSPTIHALPAWDFLAGLHIAFSLLAAERHRNRTSQGGSIELSLMDVALWASDALGILAEVQLTGVGRERVGDYVYGTFGTPFPTASGPPILVVALTQRQWSEFVKLTEIAGSVAQLESSSGSDLTNEHERWRYRDDIKRFASPWFAARTTEEALEALKSTRIVASALGNFSEVATGSGVSANDRFVPVDHPILGSFRTMGYPGRFGNLSAPAPQASPILGQDTESVLREVLQLSAAQVDDLVDRGIVRGSTQ